MIFQKIWKKSKRVLAFILAIALFFGGWGNYDFSVFAQDTLKVALSSSSAVYTGADLTPAISSVTDANNADVAYDPANVVWTNSADEDVTAAGVISAGSYEVTVSVTESVDDGAGNVEDVTHTGTAEFEVKKLDLTTCTVTADAVTYKGEAWDPQNVTVKNSAGDVVSEELYSVANLKNNTNAGTATFDIVAADANNTNVTGTKAGTFTINVIDLAACTVSAETVTYTGAELKPAVTVKLGDTVVKSDFYQVEYSNNTNAGTGNFIVKPADGNSSVISEKAGTFTIEAKALTADMLSISPEKEIVNGESFTSKVEVTVKDTVNNTEVELVKDTDFTVEIPDSMIERNTYTIRVSGKGNYAGTVETSFTLEYATDGTAALAGNTLAQSVYSEEVTVTPATVDYQISETVTGTYSDSIKYTATPADYIIYIQNKTTKEITEYILPTFTIDAEAPKFNSVTAPAADSDWAVSKDIVLDVSGADYGVFYTTTKQDLGDKINEEPTGMTRLDGNTLTIAESISTETTYYFYAIDNAGHVTTAEATVNKVDAEVPTLTVAGNDEKLVDNVYWKNSADLVFTVKAEDQADLSGLKEIVVEGTATDGLSCTFTEGAASAEGTFTIKEAGTYTLKAVDVAGKESNVVTIVVKQDSEAPKVVLAAPTGTDQYLDSVNNVYWFSDAAVTLPLTITDEVGASETEKSPYTVVYSTDAGFTGATEVSVNADAASVPVTLTAGNDGKTTYYFKVTDKAGNSGEIQTVTVGYDNTQAEIEKVELTQLNGDEWINLTESGETESNKTKVAFSVTAADAETGIKVIEYSSDNGSTWNEAVCTENNGVYTFVTNETYTDSDAYVWKVRVANNVTNDSEKDAKAAVASAIGGKIDTTAPYEEVYIKFLSDITGANDVNQGSVTNKKWSSNILEVVGNAWNNIWGNTTITFEVYVKDNLSGIQSIEMLYKDENGNDVPINLGEVTGVKAFNIGDANYVDEADGTDKTQKGYTVYTGEITLAQSNADDILVKDFQIKSMIDKAGNVAKSVVLKNAGKDVIYLDSVAPELVSVKIGTETVVDNDRYLYKEKQDLKLTIKERFFKEEGVKYPTYTLNETNAVDGTVTNGTPVQTTADDWDAVDGTTDQWELTIPLNLVSGQEMEYQVQLNYADSSENKLVGGTDITGVADGTFTSKTFVIDNSNPKLTAYEVSAATACAVDGSPVYANVADKDLAVTFKIDDNAIDYESSKANLVVNVYNVDDTENAVLTLKEDATELTKKFDGRVHEYSFKFDGEDNVASKYYVEIAYKDALELPLVDAAGLSAVENKEGTLKSNEYIIDHVAPTFDVKYLTAASNVVRVADGVDSNGTTPLADYRAYYNTNIDVKLTFDEKYYNLVTDDALEHFEIVVIKDGSQITAPAITWTHEENVHTAEFTIEALSDHSNDGDYQFTVTYQDCATNGMLAANNSNESTKDAGEYISPILVMDTTAPEVTTSYSATVSQTLEGRDYFKADATFKIEVVDRNIRYKELKDVLSGMTAVNVDGDAIADTQLSKDIEAIVETGVEHANGSETAVTWTQELNLSTEANYDIPVNFTDLAGNEAVVTDGTESKKYESGGYTEAVTVDKQILEDNIFIKFTGDIKGANIVNTILDDATTEEGNWISKIYKFISNAWMKLWGNKEITFDVYLRDEISGIHTIEMQYLNDSGEPVVCTLTKGEDIELAIDTDTGMASVDENGEAYVVYSGSIVIDENTDLSVSQFEIVKVEDKSLNSLENVTFVDKIYLDDVAPEISIEIQDVDGKNPETNIVTDDRYFYDKSKKLVLTIDERFFGSEDESVYPICNLYSTTIDADNNISDLNEEAVVSTKDTWILGDDNQYSLTIPLNAEANKEVEYYVVLSYADPAENKLDNAEGVEGVVDGTFTSKIFVIDQLAPELVDYSVVTTDCDVQEASVLKNNTAKEDLTVNFTINDNPTYYAKTDAHDYSQENLIVKLYKEGELVKTLQDGVDEVETLTKSVDGREHTYSFSCDGENETQDKFYVTVEYKDVVDHPMIDGRTEKVDRADDAEDIVDENGTYTSEAYIIDHVKPVFDITYSDATNVVEGNVDELSNRLHAKENDVKSTKKPVAGYTAYYNKDIEVKFTFDEKYVNVINDEGNAVDCDNESTNPLDHYTFTITKNGEELADENEPVITWSHNDNIHTATFTIPALADHSNDGDYQFVVTYQDCATNKMTAALDSNETASTDGVYTSPILVMDTTAPVLTKVAYDTLNLFNTVKGKDYVNAPTTMTFTMTEHNPTPTSAYSITKEGSLTAEWSGAENARTTTLETVEMLNAKGDEQTVTLNIVDWAGNKAVLANENVLRSKTNTTFSNGEFTDKFTVDTVVPEIELEYVTYTPDRPNVEGIDYFKQPITVKVTVDEHNFDEDLFKQPVVKTDDKVAYKESGWSTSGDVHVKTFTFSADNQYDLSIIGTDNAKNKLKLNDASDMAETLDSANSKVAVSVAVDSTIPAIGDKVKPIIVIKPGTPQNETIDGQALYNTDVTYEVVVYDPLVNDYASGINDITFKVTGEDGTAATCEVNKQGSISNGSGVTVKRVGGDVTDLARGVDNKYTFNVTISSTVFNTNGIVLWVGANDVATTHNEKEVDPIAIDITKPEVVVSYDNNDVSNQKYFHDVRTATVTVTERNFSNDCLKFIVNGGDKELDFSLASTGSGNRDDAVWVAHYTFAADQDYTVDVEVQDRAKNAGTVDYVGEAPQEFTIDMTKPKITVEYDNNDVLNELYYKESRTATITIEEHNFSDEDVIIELTAKDGGRPINTPSVSSWSSDGDYHRATIHYNYDGEFTFDIEFMDLATNEADDYEMDHFIVDLTAPELEIFDIEHMSANNGIVRPGVRYSDTNYDADGTVVVMTGYHNGVVEMTGARNITATGVEFKLDDFEYVQSMDDLYTMHATVYDLAGNSSEATVMFSVNRFGSVYTFDKKTDDLVGDNGKYYTNAEQELVIIETNVDTLEFKEITLNLNGKLVTLKEGVDFTVGLDGNETTWKQYTYKLNAENFVEEGTYILTIYSEDRATNTSDNNSKGKKIEFVVDKTDPSLLISGVTNGGQYRTSSKEMTIDVEDNVRLSKVVVTINGVETVYDAAQIDEANGKLVLNIDDAIDWQDIKIVVYDAAGNIESSEELRVLVTANIFVQWYRNTPVFWGSLVGLAALAALLWWFLVGKKKKEEDEEEQVK